MADITISLVTPSAANGATVTGYTIYRSLTSGGAQTTIATNVSLPYVDTGRTAGTTYFYRVAGVNSAGTGAQSAEVSATPAATVTLGALTPSGGFQIGTATSGTIGGKTTGSTIASNIPGITVTGNAYSGTPTGSAGAISNALVETLAGAVGSPRSTAVTVAAAAASTPLKIALAGSSTPANFGSEYSGTSNARVSRSSDGITFAQATAGAFIMEVGNAIVNATNRDVKWICKAAGSTLLNNDWASNTSTYYLALRDAINAAGGCDLLFFQAGFNDSNYNAVQGRANHLARLRAFGSNIRADTGQPNLKIGFGMSQLNNGNDDINVVRQAEMDVTQDANSFLAYSPMDLATSDGIHQTQASQLISAARCAPNFIAAIGGTATYSGPQVTSVTAVDTTHTDLIFTNLGGSDITPTSAITGAEIILSNASKPTITAAVRLSANVVRLTHTTLNGLAGTVSYLAMTTIDMTGVVRDNSALTRPAIPTRQPLTLAATPGPGDTTAPTITSSLTATQAENSAFSMTLTANEPVTFSKLTGDDSALFTLTGTALSMAAKDYEIPTDANTNNTYICNLRATDGAANFTNFTVTVTVTDVAEGGPAKVVRINLLPVGSADVAGWNTWTAENSTGSGTTTPAPIANLLDTVGAVTGWAATVTVPGLVTAGATGASTGNNSGAYPDAVLVTYWYVQNPSSGWTMRISGLNSAKQYTVALLGSRATTRPAENLVVQGVTQSHNVTNNTSTVATFTNVAPTSGNVDISCNPAVVGNFAYLNTIVITEQ